MEKGDDVTLSVLQRQLLQQLEAGRRLHIVRSPLTQAPAFALLLNPDDPSDQQSFPWWRVERLLNTGHACLSHPDHRLAAEILPARRAAE